MARPNNKVANTRVLTERSLMVFTVHSNSTDIQRLDNKTHCNNIAGDGEGERVPHRHTHRVRGAKSSLKNDFYGVSMRFDVNANTIKVDTVYLC